MRWEGGWRPARLAAAARAGIAGPGGQVCGCSLAEAGEAVEDPEFAVVAAASLAAAALAELEPIR